MACWSIRKTADEQTGRQTMEVLHLVYSISAELYKKSPSVYWDQPANNSAQGNNSWSYQGSNTCHISNLTSAFLLAYKRGNSVNKRSFFKGT